MNLIDKLLLRYLQARKQQGLAGVDADRPLTLLREYRQYFEKPEQLQTFISQLLDRPVNTDILYTESYLALKADLAQNEDYFANKPYQLGALDAEVDFITALIGSFDSPHVLEIGVANGYSSACIYYALSQQSGRLFSIDLPRFANSLTGRAARIRQRLASKGMISNTGTLGDLNPGGIVPDEKYAGWLVPMSYRLSVPNVTVYGNVFHVMADLPADIGFDIVVIDAMKGYQARTRLLEQIANYLKPAGICILDGSWVNSALVDFGNKYHYPVYQLGRLGVCAKKG